MRKSISMILAIAAIILLASCGVSNSNDKFYNVSDKIRVTDSAGRQVSFPDVIDTVATSCGGAIDTYFHALQVSDKIVATNGHHSIDQLFFNPDEMPLVGKWSVDKEALAEVNPDLYIGGVNVDDLNLANRVGVRAYGIGYNTFELIEYNLKTLGVIFGVEERAAFVVDYLNDILKIVDERIATVPMEDRPTAIMLSTVPGELSSKADTMAETMMTRAGCISVVPEKYTKMPDKAIVGLETIFEWDPEIIFFQDYDCELNPEILYSDKTWQGTTAVKNRQVFEIPSAIDSWSKSDPACYLGILFMSKQVYPELFEDINIENYAVEFYSVIYELDLSIEEIGVK